MTLAYGYVKTKITSEPTMKPSHHGHETQYHLHCNLQVDGVTWDVAVNVGTNDADDLLKYKLAFDFRHPLIQTLAAADAGSHDLTGQAALPALDFLRSDLLANTGKWRDSDVMDGSDDVEPASSLKRLLSRAHQNNLNSIILAASIARAAACTTCISTRDRPRASSTADMSDSNDHNDIWQDGAVLVDIGEPEWAAYFSAFNQQMVPTDDLGNPLPGGSTI